MDKNAELNQIYEDAFLEEIEKIAMGERIAAKALKRTVPGAERMLKGKVGSPGVVKSTEEELSQRHIEQLSGIKRNPKKDVVIRPKKIVEDKPNFLKQHGAAIGIGGAALGTGAIVGSATSK